MAPPGRLADGTLQVEHYVRSAQIAERGKLDMIFFADGAGIRQGDNPPGSLARTGRDMIELEPTMLLPALAMVTTSIGLVTTASTTYNEPYNIARRFATLDLISKGRAGWNVVASWSEHEAQNFGLETTLDYDTRYARSAEFVDVVKGLWDGREDGALLLDKAGGRYFDEARMHVLNHHGRFFKVRGPLSVACMPQRHPVIVQAGASEQGRELGAATADVIYAIHGSLNAAQAYYADVKGRMAKFGREPDDLKIMPGSVRFWDVPARTPRQSSMNFRSWSIRWPALLRYTPRLAICRAIRSTVRCPTMRSARWECAVGALNSESG